MKQQEFEKTLNDIAAKLKRLSDAVYDLEIDNTDAETRSRFYAIRSMEDPLWKMQRIMDNMYAKVSEVGQLVKNVRDRYELAGQDVELTSGNSVHVWDDEDECWRYSRVEHNGRDYYIVSLGKDTPIEGRLVRRPCS